MLAMSEKKIQQPKRMGRPPKDPTIPKGGRSKMQLTGRVTPEVFKRFKEFCERYRREIIDADDSAHVEKAIIEYLDRQDAAK